MRTYNFFMGYCINVLPLDKLLAACAEKIKTSQAKNLVFSCANPHSIAIANTNNDFKNALKGADILVTDGVGLSVVGRLLGANVGPRITGGDFFSSLMDYQNTHMIDRKTKVYFFGSSQKVLDLIKANLEHHYQNIDFCGFTSPPYGNWSESENDAFIEMINAARPDILWVGMTAPKQELWSHKNREKLSVSVIGNIGAVFDFCAGTYERAPEWARRAGVEWLIRLIKEPKRMWRRNFLSPVIFTLAAIRYKLSIHDI